MPCKEFLAQMRAAFGKVEGACFATYLTDKKGRVIVDDVFPYGREHWFKTDFVPAH